MRNAGSKHLDCRLLGRRASAAARGMVLVEVLVVTALSTIVMGTVISLAVVMLQRDRAIRSFAVQRERQSELAEKLRTEIRQAIDVSLPAETMLVVTAVNGAQTRYELTRAGCRQTVTGPGRDNPGIDLFAVGPATSWTLEKGPPGRRPLFIVTLNRAAPNADPDARPAPLIVYAALGADLPDVVTSTDVE
jgi:hypothetical protein